MLFKWVHSELCIYLSIFVVFLFLINNIKISEKTPSFFFILKLIQIFFVSQKIYVFICLFMQLFIWLIDEIDCK